MEKKYNGLRETVCAFARKAADEGLVSGSSGNVSVRAPGGEGLCVITPSGIGYDALLPEQVVVCDEKGNKAVGAETEPSMELPLHSAIYKARNDVHAIVHTHAVYSTVVSVLRIGIPPIIEEMVPFLGGELGVAEYAPAGSRQLADNVTAALGGKAAVLLANHGNLGVGKDLDKAFYAALLCERVARIYVESLKIIGAPAEKIHTIPEDVVEKEKEMYENMKQ